MDEKDRLDIRITIEGASEKELSDIIELVTLIIEQKYPDSVRLEKNVLIMEFIALLEPIIKIYGVNHILLRLSHELHRNCE